MRSSSPGDGPLLSIITVTRDNLDGLRATLASVDAAIGALPNVAGAVEIVVKDGGSSDGTAAFLERVARPDIVVVTGADGGVYPAMNQALDIARGQWVLYLNAGDRLASADVLGKLLDRIDQAGDVNLIYSDTVLGRNLFRQTLSIGFLTRHMINHQTLCYRRDLLGAGYDLRYRLSADYAHLLRVYSDIRAEKLTKPISAYDTGGMSSDPRNFHVIWRERLLAVWRSPLPFLTQLRLSSRGIVMWPLQYVRAVLT